MKRPDPYGRLSSDQPDHPVPNPSKQRWQEEKWVSSAPIHPDVDRAGRLKAAALSWLLQVMRVDGRRVRQR